MILTIASVHSTRVFRVTPAALESDTLSVSNASSCVQVYCGVKGIVHSFFLEQQTEVVKKNKKSWRKENQPFFFPPVGGHAPTLTHRSSL